MKKIAVLLLAFSAITGCVTRKVPILEPARDITPISELAAKKLDCEMVDTYVLEDSHPNNVDRELKNQTYQLGGNRFNITSVLEERSGRPSSVVAEIYSCPVQNSGVSGISKLLPGAHDVKPIAFAEIENTNCKVIGSHVVEQTSPDTVYTELANAVYMRGGNRYHITNIIGTDGERVTSVSADVYRCQHRSVAF